MKKQKFIVYCYWDRKSVTGILKVKAKDEEKALEFAYGVTGVFDLISRDGEEYRGNMSLPSYCTV